MDSIITALNRSHAVLLAAKHASARRHLGQAITTWFTQQGYLVRSLAPQSGKIGIADIRQLYAQTAYRQRGRQLMLQLVLEAHTMTAPAQNAFLKLLEEPPRGVKFLLLCPSPESMLLTIRSRCAVVIWQPQSFEQFQAEFPDLAESDLLSLYYLSEGDSLEAKEQQKQTEDWTALRGLVGGPLAGSVLNLPNYNSSREQAAFLSDRLTIMARVGVRRANTLKQRRLWLKRLQSAITARERLNNQANVKLVVDSLLLDFRSI